MASFLDIFRSLVLALAGATLVGCGPSKDAAPRAVGGPRAEASPSGAATDSGEVVPLRHAIGFTLRRSPEATWVTVQRPWQDASRNFRYRLIPRSDSTSGSTSAGVLTLPVPVRRVLTMTTTNLPHLEAIGALGALVGISGGQYACHEWVRAGLQSGTLREVGEESGLDAEAVLNLRPEAVFAFAVADWTNPALKKLNEAGLPVVMEAAYMEETPLGRAEWIRFTAEFFGKGRAADSAFGTVDSAYQSLAALARGVARRPTVVVNAPFGGVWHMPGGRSYVARLLADAGADYLWAEDTTRGSLSLDLEAVLAKAGSAEFWLNPGQAASLGELRRLEPRANLFGAFKAGRIWNNDAVRCGAGNEFHEVGSSRPDLILADLIALFHPHLLPGHRFRWHRKLEEG